MPRFRKLNPDETAAAEQRPISDRAQIAPAYDALLSDFVIGEYGRAELIAGEQRNSVRSWLHAAARRRGLALRFRPSLIAALIFRVEAASMVVPMLIHEPASAALVAAQRNEAARRDPAPLRPPRPVRRPPSGITRCCRAGCVRVGRRAEELAASGDKGDR